MYILYISFKENKYSPIYIYNIYDIEEYRTAMRVDQNFI